MTPGRLPAKVIVAPNSPSARAQVRAAPAASPGATMGSVTVAKTRSGPAPSEAAVSSYRACSPASAPSRLMTRNGIETKVAATTAPAVWNGSCTPNQLSSHPPSRPRRPNPRSSATPPTVGGSTIGSSTRERTSALPGKSTRASSQASGTPSSRDRPSAQQETTSEIRRASTTPSEVRWVPSAPQEVRARMPAMGTSRKATARTAGTARASGTRRPGTGSRTRPGRRARPAPGPRPGSVPGVRPRPSAGVRSRPAPGFRSRCTASRFMASRFMASRGSWRGRSVPRYGCWKPASRRIFCASAPPSHFTKASASLVCFETFSVAAGYSAMAFCSSGICTASTLSGAVIASVA